MTYTNLERSQNLIDDLKTQYGHSLIVAHRGYVKNQSYQRNTLYAFENALEQGAHGIEGDLRLTADNKVVIHHNPWVRNGFKIKRIRTNTYQELVNVFNDKALIPQLKDVMELLPTDKIIFMQIKNPDTYDVILEEIRKTAPSLDQIFVMGYLDSVLDRALDPEINYGKHYLFPSKSNLNWILMKNREHNNIPIASPAWNLMTNKHLKLIKKSGLQSVVFTVNYGKVLKNLIQNQTDVIYTDQLEKALQLL